jgi:tRNA(fMet)-specific endonuclease VapC
MKYLLDTNICIYFLNQDKFIVEKMSSISINDMAISIITIAELQYGVFNSNKVKENLRRINFLKDTCKDNKSKHKNYRRICKNKIGIEKIR